MGFPAKRAWQSATETSLCSHSGVSGGALVGLGVGVGVGDATTTVRGATVGTTLGLLMVVGTVDLGAVVSWGADIAALANAPPIKKDTPATKTILRIATPLYFFRNLENATNK